MLATQATLTHGIDASGRKSRANAPWLDDRGSLSPQEARSSRKLHRRTRASANRWRAMSTGVHERAGVALPGFCAPRALRSEKSQKARRVRVLAGAGPPDPPTMPSSSLPPRALPRQQLLRPRANMQVSDGCSWCPGRVRFSAPLYLPIHRLTSQHSARAFDCLQTMNTRVNASNLAARKVREQTARLPSLNGVPPVSLGESTSGSGRRSRGSRAARSDV